MKCGELLAAGFLFSFVATPVLLSFYFQSILSCLAQSTLERACLKFSSCGDLEKELIDLGFYNGCLKKACLGTSLCTCSSSNLLFFYYQKNSQQQ